MQRWSNRRQAAALLARSSLPPRSAAAAASHEQPTDCHALCKLMCSLCCNGESNTFKAFSHQGGGPYGQCSHACVLSARLTGGRLPAGPAG